MLTTFIATILVAQGPFQPVNHLPLPKESNEFTFVALGDNRPAGSGQPPTDVFKRILTEVGWIHPAFVLSTGDLIYGNEESVDMYRKECAWIKPIIASIGVPFFNAPGNHEINGRAEFQAEYVKLLGPMYGSFDYGGCRFIALATDTAETTAKYAPEEIPWLDSALSSKKPAFIYQHHPVFARPVKGPEDGAAVADGTSFAAKFSASNVQAVFEGHDHVFNHQSHDGVEYFIAGGAGAPLDANPEDGGYFHYVLVHVKNGKADYTVMPLGSIDVRQNGDDIRVSSYCNADVDLGNVVVTSAKAPHAVHASYDKKGKMTETNAGIVSVEKSGNGFIVHLSLSLKKHRQTIIHFE
jgi:hypothetical protein